MPFVKRLFLFELFIVFNGHFWKLWANESIKPEWTSLKAGHYYWQDNQLGYGKQSFYSGKDISLDEALLKI